MITIPYEFDNDTIYIDTDLSEYIKQLTDNEKCEIGKTIFDGLDIIEKEDITNEYGENAITFNPSYIEAVNLSENLIQDAEYSEIYKIKEEEINDFYESEAYEEYQNYITYDGTY